MFNRYDSETNLYNTFFGSFASREAAADYLNDNCDDRYDYDRYDDRYDDRNDDSSKDRYDLNPDYVVSDMICKTTTHNKDEIIMDKYRLFNDNNIDVQSNTFKDLNEPIETFFTIDMFFYFISQAKYINIKQLFEKVFYNYQNYLNKLICDNLYSVILYLNGASHLKNQYLENIHYIFKIIKPYIITDNDDINIAREYLFTERASSWINYDKHNQETLSYSTITNFTISFREYLIEIFHTFLGVQFMNPNGDCSYYVISKFHIIKDIIKDIPYFSLDKIHFMKFAQSYNEVKFLFEQLVPKDNIIETMRNLCFVKGSETLSSTNSVKLIKNLSFNIIRSTIFLRSPVKVLEVISKYIPGHFEIVEFIEDLCDMQYFKDLSDLNYDPNSNQRNVIFIYTQLAKYVNFVPYTKELLEYTKEKNDAELNEYIERVFIMNKIKSAAKR